MSGARILHRRQSTSRATALNYPRHAAVASSLLEGIITEVGWGATVGMAVVSQGGIGTEGEEGSVGAGARVLTSAASAAALGGGMGRGVISGSNTVAHPVATLSPGSLSPPPHSPPVAPSPRLVTHFPLSVLRHLVRWVRPRLL